ncbi:CG30379 [Drosophila busckii]|uniref:CG30379 n=1 Tax=Drosophila busckii TaxID=30019 RepID=A0A0M4EBR3_DROBS|nr:protein lifeguard 2 [Drosophila busckii]ALC42746.1 CG30379 [Drosophila busckii]
MSYNRMKTEESNNISVPLSNGERYPPIPLPPPNAAAAATKEAMATENNINMTGMNAVPMMEAGQIIIPNTQVLIVPGTDTMEAKNMIFNDQSIRKGFIRKVYFILLTQLLFTCGVISIFMYHMPTKYFVQENPIVVCVAMIANLIIMCSMVCCEVARRRFPLNFILLAMFTVTMSLMLGAVASTLDVDMVLLAVGITAVMVIALSIYAIQTKYDFTAWGGVLISVVILLLILAIAGSFLRTNFGNTAVSSLGALLASFLLIYDTQLIMGGKHKYQFNPEDYIFAALTLYLDVVRIFLYVLRLAKR